MFTLTTCTNPQQSPPGCIIHLKHLNRRGCSLLVQYTIKIFTTALSFLIPSEQQTLFRPVVSKIWCNEHLKEQAPFSPFTTAWFSVPWVSTLLAALQAALVFHSPGAPDSLWALFTPQSPECTPHCREESCDYEIAEVTSLYPLGHLFSQWFLFLFKVQLLFRNLARVTPVHKAARSQ